MTSSKEPGALSSVFVSGLLWKAYQEVRSPKLDILYELSQDFLSKEFRPVFGYTFLKQTNKQKHTSE